MNGENIVLENRTLTGNGYGYEKLKKGFNKNSDKPIELYSYLENKDTGTDYIFRVSYFEKKSKIYFIFLQICFDEGCQQRMNQWLKIFYFFYFL